ncbi:MULTISPECIES: YegP family protein [Sneathiella]|jgi:uncharacterized protein YegP (UPF0339 family)|uniref:YegP family protein n=1 Tax=Sneathiella TaxID=510690 RepID=UPI00146A5CDD|nr:DUF1508 domain-containing protein [Sneathiella aquimaris]
MKTNGDNDKWEIYKDKGDEWRWRRTAPNGRIVGASTEGYIKKQDCVDNAIRNGFPETD